MAITRRQCDKESLLRNRDHRWQFWMLAQTLTGYILSSTSLTDPVAGMHIPGAVKSIGVWMQEAHGPSVMIKDVTVASPSINSPSTLSLDLEIKGLDVFGEPLKVRMMGLNGSLVDTGTITVVSVVDGGGNTNDFYRLSVGTWQSYGFAVGDLLVITGFANATNNITRAVTAISDDGRDLSVASTALVVEAAGASVRVRTTGFSSSGRLYQCPQAFSYVDTVTVLNIIGAVLGDLIRIGCHQPRDTGNQVRYGLPFKMKSADSFVALFDRSDGTAITKNVQLANGTFTMDVAEVSAGTHRFTAVFDPRAMER